MNVVIKRTLGHLTPNQPIEKKIKKIKIKNKYYGHIAIHTQGSMLLQYQY